MRADYGVVNSAVWPACVALMKEGWGCRGSERVFKASQRVVRSCAKALSTHTNRPLRRFPLLKRGVRCLATNEVG